MDIGLIIIIGYSIFVIRNIIVDPDPWSEKFKMLGFLVLANVVVGTLVWFVPALSWFFTYRGNTPF